MLKTAKSRPRRRPPRKATPERLVRAALAHLERYATSTANLRRVLMRRVIQSHEAHGTDIEEGAAAIDALLNRYQDAGLLDDPAYARLRIVSLRRRGASKRMIRANLAAKGVAAAVIGDALDDLESDEPDSDLTAACRYARRRRLGPWRRDDRATGRERDLAALSRQGFSYDVARRVIDAESAEFLLDAAEAG